MPETSGINHLGLFLASLESTRDFFVELLGWEESGYDPSYPRTAVSDGVVRLTLWEVDHQLKTVSFHRRENIGLHHLALQVESEQKLEELFRRASEYPGFAPELAGSGPRKHMMCYEPGGIRIEFIWPGK